MRKKEGKGIGSLILTVFIIFLLLRIFGGEGSGLGDLLMRFISIFFWTGLIICLAVFGIAAAVLYWISKDNKYRRKHDPPSVTPPGARKAAEQNTSTAGESAGTQGSSDTPDSGKNTAGAVKQENYQFADRTKTYEKTPEGITRMMEDYRTDCALGQLAGDALKQKERLKSQQLSYKRLVERRFGQGTLSAEKYLTVEKSSDDALQNGFLRIANRMEAFDSREYMHFRTGAYKWDSIPDHVQEQRQEIYEENLRYMKDCLADNEHILAGMDRLMLKLAEAQDTDESDILEEIEELERQLAYYRKQL